MSLLEGAEEGTAFGTALLARFRHLSLVNEAAEWTTFLDQLAPQRSVDFQPSLEESNVYDEGYGRYLGLLQQLVVQHTPEEVSLS